MHEIELLTKRMTNELPLKGKGIIQAVDTWPLHEDEKSQYEIGKTEGQEETTGKLREKKTRLQK